MENLVASISTLCSQERRFHTKQREHELKSLNKYMVEFRNFSHDEFVNFVCRHYIKNLRNCKRFCSQSIFNRISAIQNRLGINVMTRRRYLTVLKSLRKLFNPYSTDTQFYTSTGRAVTVPPRELKMLRENAKYLISMNETNVADRWKLNTYTDQEIEIIYKYFLMNLENFIYSKGTLPNDYDLVFIELCMIVVFCYNTPRRVSEILNLTVEQIEQLIIHNTVNIKSKGAYDIDCIYVSVKLGDMLNRFVNKMYPDLFERNTPHLRIFHSSYKVYYTRMRNTLKTLIGAERLVNLRIFHGFRNYYALKHINTEGAKECQKILGHGSLSMTRRYANSQASAANTQAKQKQKVLDYLNKVAK